MTFISSQTNHYYGKVLYNPLIKEDTQPKEPPVEVRLNHILLTVCDYFGLLSSDVKGRNKKRVFVDARAIYAGISKHLVVNGVQISDSMIGEFLGKRDASTIHFYRNTHLKIDEVEKHYLILKKQCL